MDWSRLNILKNLPMAWKMTVIPVMAIVALLGVYLITKTNLDTYQVKVDQAAAAEAIIKHEKAARIAEKNYLRRDAEKEIEKLREHLAQIDTLVQETKASLDEQSERARMERILQAKERYAEGFDQVAEYRETFQTVSDKMVTAARSVEEAAVNLAKELRQELQSLIDSGDASGAIADKRMHLETLNRMVLLLKEARVAEKNYIRRDDEGALQKAKENIDQVRTLAQQTKDRLNQAEDRARMDSILEAGGNYGALLDKYASTREKSQKQVDTMVQAARSLEQEASQFSSSQVRERNAVRAGLETTVLTVTLAAMAVIGLIAFVTTRIILGPINSVSATVQHIQRDKDFTERARADGNDEIGRMAGSVNDLVDNQTELLNGLQQQTAQVAAASEELSSTADEITRNARSSSQRVEEVSSSAQEVNNVVQDVANNIAEVSDSASKTTDRTQKGMQTVDQAAERIDNLKGSTQRVDEIMETIENIAKQTDLLALNAAIEAANAGEQGKGFAVVADEVRKLAEQTSDATGQVNKIVSELREQSESSVTAMSDVQTQMKEVLEMIEHTDSTANQIAAAAEELAATMGETTSNMTEISSSVEQVAGSVTQVESAAEQLGELAHNLRASVDQYKLE
ncbi:methyl-accepting chemotaxis protein [Thiohalorhabdus sp. Cl-TMA]|uniref:Methyl-accepting chemotaxis protein n=1 Tax=Thiohalorhabdus methylotrophus TaxID=3242694 RepID=A0ABV4TUZ1_9GAMM